MEETSFILEIAYQWSYLGVYIIALIANAFPGIPEEMFILGLGYLGSTPNFHMVPVAILAFLGMFTSDCVIFGLSRGGVKLYRNIARRFLGEEDMKKIAKSSFAKRHIRKIIFFSRFVVQVRFLGPFLAGVHRVSWRTFLFFNTLAVIIYIPMMLFLGSYFQGRIVKIISGTNVVRNYFMILLAVAALFIIVRVIRKGFIKQLLESDHVHRMKTFFGISKIDPEKFTEELRDDFPVVYTHKDAPGFTYDKHEHQGDVAFYVTQGSITMQFSEHEQIVRAGDRIDILPNTPHAAVVGEDGCEYIVGQEIEDDA